MPLNVGEVTRTPDLSLRRRLHYPLCYTNIYENPEINRTIMHY